MKFIATPYLPGASERVNSILKPFKIKISNKPTNTLHRKLNNQKKKNDILETVNCIYKFDCLSCPKTYIGQTKKQLYERINQHEYSIRNQHQNSLPYQH